MKYYTLILNKKDRMDYRIDDRGVLQWFYEWEWVDSSFKDIEELQNTSYALGYTLLEL